MNREKRTKKKNIPMEMRKTSNKLMEGGDVTKNKFVMILIKTEITVLTI